MKPEDQYHRYVRWSDEDSCYIGYCPDLYLGGVCYSEIEENCYSELCDIIREEIQHRKTQNDPLLRPKTSVTKDHDFATTL